MIKSSNPALGDKTFDNLQLALAAEGRMTINGTINKTLILLVLALVPAAWVWDKFYKGGAEAVGNWLLIAVIAGLVVAMVTMGWPDQAFPAKLTRRPLSEMVFADSYGAPLEGLP